MLSFNKEIAKIGPADPEIIVLQAIIKKDNKKKDPQSRQIERGVRRRMGWGTGTGVPLPNRL